MSTAGSANQPSGLGIVLRTDGRTGTGRGLVGLRQRIRRLGGQFSAGATGAGGWLVEARLPGPV